MDAENGSRFAEVMTPPLSPAHAAHLAPLPERLFVYEFEIPQTLCGLLIGRFGAYVHHIKAKTGASLLIKRHMTNKRLKVCAIEGIYIVYNYLYEFLFEFHSFFGYFRDEERN